MAHYSHSGRKTNHNPNTNLNPNPIITCVPANWALAVNPNLNPNANPNLAD